MSEILDFDSTVDQALAASRDTFDFVSAACNRIRLGGRPDLDEARKAAARVVEILKAADLHARTEHKSGVCAKCFQPPVPAAAPESTP